MKKLLKGTSLVEALVASVIFITVFLIAMNSVVSISRVNHSGASPAEMEETIRDCMERFEKGKEDRASYDYSWGRIEINAESYGKMEDLSDVTLTAKAKNGCTIIYRYLLCRD